MVLWMDAERKEERQIESETGSRPTLSLPLFLRCPRTLCYCDVCSSSSLLHSAVEAFCSPLIHTRPRHLRISEWMARWADLKRLWSSIRRRRRWKHSHVWLHPSASDFRSCSGRDRSSHAQPSPCRLNNFIFFQQGKWRPQWSHFLWLLRRSSQKQRERWWIVVIKTLTTIRKVWSHCEVRAALTLQFQRLHSTHISSFFKLQSENSFCFCVYCF